MSITENDIEINYNELKLNEYQINVNKDILSQQLLNGIGEQIKKELNPKGIKLFWMKLKNYILD